MVKSWKYSFGPNILCCLKRKQETISVIKFSNETRHVGSLMLVLAGCKTTAGQLQATAGSLRTLQMISNSTIQL